MKYYALNKDYVNWLRAFDSKIEEIDYGNKFKPYIGVALDIEQFKYFIPLSSYKKKYDRLKDDIDFLKITNLKDKSYPDYWVYGALNINNMIPVPDSQIERLDMDNLQKYRYFKGDKDKYDYRMLLENEYLWIKKNRTLIQVNAKELYDKVVNNPGKNKSLVARCCDWKLLEQKSTEYQDAIQNQDTVESFKETASSVDIANDGQVSEMNVF